MKKLVSSIPTKGKHYARKIHRDKGVKYTFLRFGVVGFFGTLVDFAVLYLLVQFLHLNPIWAKLLANESAIINNFILNNIWTFGKRETLKFPLWQRFISYNLTYLVSLVMSALLMGGLISLFGKEPYLFYNIFTIPINVIWNFTLSHKFTWKEKIAEVMGVNLK
jgi:dolichol-phosphate mannosyltransferase